MQKTLTTTLSLLREHSACASGYENLLVSLPEDYPDDAPINLLRILESNGVYDMLWALRATREDSTRIGVLMAADFAEHVLLIFERFSPSPAPRQAIVAVRDWVAGKITIAEVKEAALAVYVAADAAVAPTHYAAHAACSAAHAACSAAYATRSAEHAGCSAAHAACSVAGAACFDPPGAYSDVGGATCAVSGTAYAAAEADDSDECVYQADIIRKYLTE